MAEYPLDVEFQVINIAILLIIVIRKKNEENSTQKVFKCTIKPNRLIQQTATDINGYTVEDDILYHKGTKVPKERTPAEGLKSFTNYLRSLQNDQPNKTMLILVSWSYYTISYFDI